jgi:hypothetical protein
MYKVILACKEHCPDWEEERETLRTGDADEAIRKSEMHRDQMHSSWVERVN